MWQENLAFHSALSPDAVLETLARTTDKEGMTSFSLSGFKGKQAFLSKVDGNMRRIYASEFMRQTHKFEHQTSGRRKLPKFPFSRHLV
jgi:hypothetical protein